MPCDCVEIGNAVLYCADNEKILPFLPIVDSTITDPPYSNTTHSNSRTNKYGAGKRHISFGSFSNAKFLEYVELMLNKTNGWLVFTCDYRHAALLYDHPAFIRLGAWVKTNPMPQISGDRPGQGFETVAILHSGRIKKEWNRGGGAGVWITPAANKALVPTQKPKSLIAHFFDDFTKQGDIVLDPFMGAGTTGVVALQKGRRFIGIEAKKEHFDIAVKEIRKAYEQCSLLRIGTRFEHKEQEGTFMPF